ncbi:MAG: hypothetical protein LBH01_11950 [Verrucomicrobiales bacterium]|jgi:hypothetical protein|nr:hypothetical protein [Verrucomicrobiales bacterium]
MNVPRKDRVLFLDIDGVLNTPQDRMYPDPDECLTKELLARLDAFVSEVQCSIVISSSWRYRHTVFSLRQVFARHGFANVEAIIDFTPDLQTGAWNNLFAERGLEIDAWLKEHSEATHYAILDDTNDMVHLVSHFVQVDDVTGITNADLVKIKDILES